MSAAFDRLHPAVQHHVVNSLGWPALLPLQEAAIDPILEGNNALLIAPTAGGKTEAAFLPVLSQILTHDLPPLSVLYIAPLRALLNNLEERLSWYCGLVGRTARLWHGDVTQAERAAVLRDLPDVLLTTPESIEAMLVSRRVNHQAVFGRVRFAICDELHAFAGDDRGWHLRAVLSRAAPKAQRIGLSATVGNPEQLLEWFAPEPRRVIAPSVGSPSEADVTIDYVGSVENAAHVLSSLYRGEKRLVFCDSRSQAEQIAARLNARKVETFVSHSSLSKDERRRAEKAFAEARDCVIVATSTLELGIDVGDLDRVIQIDAPAKVASFLQRLGRTGRRPGSKRNCLFLATTPESLLRAAAIDLLWREGWVEPTVPPPYPVHVTAQQIMGVALHKFAQSAQSLLSDIGHLPDKLLILNHMLELGFVSHDEGLLMIGPEAARLYAGRNYMEVLSVFDTPELFDVRFGGQELGWVHELSLHTRDGSPAVLLLGGRAWQVRFVDWKTHRVGVEPTEEHGRSTWLGNSAPLGYELCQAMRRVLMSETTSPAWSKRAIEELASFRNLPITDPTHTVMVETDTGTEWWTFAGLRGNAALALRLPEVQSFNNVMIRARCRPTELRNIRLESTTGTPPPQSQPKFADCLPPEVLTRFYNERLYDRAAADQILKMGPAVWQAPERA